MVEPTEPTHISDEVIKGDHPAANENKHNIAHGARTKVGTDGKVQDGKLGGELKFVKNPAFLKSRVEFFDNLYKE